MTAAGDEEVARPQTSLEETFYLISKKNTVYRVRLSEKGLLLEKETGQKLKAERIAIEDLVGSRVVRGRRGGQRCSWRRAKRPQDEADHLECGAGEEGRSSQADISACLYIYAYILKKTKTLSGGLGSRRERMVVTLRFRSYDSFEENCREAERWRLAISYLMRCQNSVPFCHQPPVIKPDNKILFILNPKSGVGKAREIFQSKVVPLLTEADINYDLHCTSHANDAQAFVRARNVWEYSGGVTVVGGDGLLFEVVNGLMERCDWSLVFSRLPLGIIPCGSGNGLAKSIAFTSNEPYDQNPVLISTLNVVRGSTAPLDLIRVETPHRVIYSFLSIGWGIISDVDIESERLRSIGAQRFTIWSVAKLVGMRSYKGRVSYIPVSPNHKGTKADCEVESLTSCCEEGRRDSFHSVGSRKSTYHSATGSSYESLAEIGEGVAEGALRTYGPASTLPQLSEPLSAAHGWVTLEGEFVLVHASYPSHLMLDCFFAPSARLDDGCIWLCIIKAGISRTRLAQFLMGLSTGSHLKTREALMVPVSALRLEPEGGQLTVDGEAVELGPLQAEVLPSMARVFARPL